MLTRLRKRLDYNKLVETGERTEKQLKSEEETERDDIVEVPELLNLLKSISVSEDLQLGSTEENMSRENIDAFSRGKWTKPGGISDFIDKNQEENILDESELDSKISKVEELRIV